MSVENIKKKSVQDTSTSHFYSRIIFTPKKLGYMLPTPYKVKAHFLRNVLLYHPTEKTTFCVSTTIKKREKKTNSRKTFEQEEVVVIYILLYVYNLYVLSILTKAGARHRI